MAVATEGHPNRTHYRSVSGLQPHTLLHAAVLLAGRDVTQSLPASSSQTEEKSEHSPRLLFAGGPSAVRRPNQEQTRHTVFLEEASPRQDLGKEGRRLVETRRHPCRCPFTHQLFRCSVIEMGGALARAKDHGQRARRNERNRIFSVQRLTGESDGTKAVTKVQQSSAWKMEHKGGPERLGASPGGGAREGLAAHCPGQAHTLELATSLCTRLCQFLLLGAQSTYWPLSASVSSFCGWYLPHKVVEKTRGVHTA